MATYVPKNMADLEKWVLQQTMEKTKEAMTKKFYAILESTYDKYVQRWYSQYTPTAYPRTMEFATDLPVEIKPYVSGNSVVCGVKFDENQLSHDVWEYYNYKTRSIEEMVHHGENPDLTHAIVSDALEKGGHGFRKPTETKPYVDTLEELKSNMGLFMNELKSELSKNGFVVK